MRGLKLHLFLLHLHTIVASFTDAWIETIYFICLGYARLSHLLQMRGLKREYTPPVVPHIKSHLLQMRGLKPDR